MGHPVLRTKARTVDKLEIKTQAVQDFIDSMVDTMFEYTGVGLAAPQVHESLRLFVAMLDADGQGDGDALVLINPEITVVGASPERYRGTVHVAPLPARDHPLPRPGAG